MNDSPSNTTAARPGATCTARRNGQIIVGAPDTARTLPRGGGRVPRTARRRAARPPPAPHARPPSHAPETIDSRPAQCGARSSRLSTFPAPDFGSGSVRTSICFGTL